MSRSLFIAGATGAVGRITVEVARRAGLTFTAHARASSASKLKDVPVSTVDLRDAGALTAALRGHTTVLQLIGTMAKRFATGDTYEASDIGTTRQLVEAAKASGTVDHVIVLSSAWAGRPIGAYLKAKAEAERIARDSGLGWTAIRPNAFEDREGISLKGTRAFTNALGLHSVKPIRVREVAVAILLSARDRQPLGTALEGKPLWEFVARGLEAFPE